MADRAIAVSLVSQQAPQVRLGNVRAALIVLTFTGTDVDPAPLTPAMCGLQEIYLVIPETDAGDNGSVPGAGWVPQYNYVTQEIQLYGGAASTDDLAPSDESSADVQVRCLVIGV